MGREVSKGGDKIWHAPVHAQDDSFKLLVPTSTPPPRNTSAPIFPTTSLPPLSPTINSLALVNSGLTTVPLVVQLPRNMLVALIHFLPESMSMTICHNISQDPGNSIWILVILLVEHIRYMYIGCIYSSR